MNDQPSAAAEQKEGGLPRAESKAEKRAASGAEPSAITGRVLRAHGPSLASRIGDKLISAIQGLGYRSLFYSLRLRGSFPLKLALSPKDPWPADPSQAAALAQGNYLWAGFERTSALPPFDAEDAPEGLLEYLHGFRWLRDLAALEKAQAAKVAEAGVRHWLDKFASFHPLAWRADVLGERFIFWASHAPLILSSNDLIYRSKVLNSMARQARHLARSAPKAEDGLPRIWAATGLIYSGLVLPGGQARRSKGEGLLTRELGHFITSDGGVATRSPADALDILQLMINLRTLYRDLQVEAPGGVQLAIDRLTPALKALTMGDGCLAAFHGAGPSHKEGLALAISLSECDAQPMVNGAISGYQRMVGAKSLVVVDAGPPPAVSYSLCGHASPLAFEFSHDGQRILVNCGAGERDKPLKPELARMTRTTAAHNALVLANTNAAQIRRDGYIGRGPEEVRYSRREGAEGVWLDLDHDGYLRRYGVLHKRRLFLAANGLDLRGEDSLLMAEGRLKSNGVAGRDVDIRFHLHPDVEATPTQDGEAAILRLPDKHGWMFRARGAKLTIDDSLFIDGNGAMRRTKQLVLNTPLHEIPMAVNWSCKAMTS